MLAALIRNVVGKCGVKCLPEFREIKPKDGEHVLEVPSYAQTDGYSCGATAALSLVRAFRPESSLRFVYRTVAPEPYVGVGYDRVVKTLSKYHLKVKVVADLNWYSMRSSLDRGRPLIVGTGKDTFRGDGNHWSTVYGYGTSPNRVLLGNQGGLISHHRWVEWGSFKRYWWGPVGFALICWE